MSYNLNTKVNNLNIRVNGLDGNVNSINNQIIAINEELENINFDTSVLTSDIGLLSFPQVGGDNTIVITNETELNSALGSSADYSVLFITESFSITTTKNITKPCYIIGLNEGISISSSTI